MQCSDGWRPDEMAQLTSFRDMPFMVWEGKGGPVGEAQQRPHSIQHTASPHAIAWDHKNALPHCAAATNDFLHYQLNYENWNGNDI